MVYYLFHKSVTRRYSEPKESTACLPFLFIEDQIFILHLYLSLPSGSFLQGFPIKIPLTVLSCLFHSAPHDPLRLYSPNIICQEVQLVRY